MPSRLTVEESMKIIDRHLLPSAGEQTVRSSVATGCVPVDRPRGGREEAPAPTLPAFYTCARDGPSPYDTHKGSYQCSIDNVWNDQAQFELGFVQPDAQGVRWHVDGPGKSLKSTEAVAILTTRTPDDYLVTAESLRAPRMVIAAPSAKQSAGSTADRGVATDITRTDASNDAAAAASGPSELFDDVWVTNPQRDRMALESEVGNARAAHFATELQSRQRQLYTKSVRVYPHGALGIRESPYGPETGAVYAQHRQALLRDAQREGRAVRRLDVPRPADSLFGSCAYRGEEPVHGPRTGNAPSDHLLGGYVVRGGPQPQEPHGNASSMFYSP